MEFEKVVFSRKSIRKYQKKNISKDCLEHICMAGFAAPSARNIRPWECVIIQNKCVLLMLSEMKSQWCMLRNAAAAILLIGKEDKYFQQNCAASVQNMLLDATDQYIGSVWLGLYPNQELMKEISVKFKLPKEKVPFCLIALGYPDEEKAKRSYNDQWRIHYETY